MAKKYNQMHQHQPLPVPRMWSGEEMRFATQLEEILDDIYRVFNRMKLSDLAGDLRLTDTEGNETVSISAGGDITAKSLAADSITIGGQDLMTVIKESFVDKVIVSDTQPDAHGVVWVKPAAQGSGQAGGEIEESVTFSGEPSLIVGTSTARVTIPLGSKTGSVTADECKYHAVVRMRNTKGKRRLTNIHVTISGTNSGNETGTVTLLNKDTDMLLNVGDYIVIDNETMDEAVDLENLTFGDAMTMVVILSFSDMGAVASGGQTTVRAYATREDETGDAMKTCEVYYLS